MAGCGRVVVRLYENRNFKVPHLARNSGYISGFRADDRLFGSYYLSNIPLRRSLTPLAPDIRSCARP
jgi:hypothetical protein